MATGLDQAAGYGMVLLAATVFTYYTLWVVVLPFVESEHFLQQFFLPRIYAVSIPITAGCILLACIGIFVGSVMLKSRKKEKSS